MQSTPPAFAARGGARRATPARLAAVSVALVVIVAACGRDDATSAGPDRPRSAITPTTTAVAPPEPARDPLLFLSGWREVVALGTDDGEVVMRAVNGQVAPDRSAIAQVVGNRVIAIDPATGGATWEHTVAAERRVRVVAPGARQVALVDGLLAQPSTPRRTTTVTIADASGARELTVAGNVDPEAFTRDGRSLVAVEYLPSMNPDHYSVRLIDLTTGEIRPVPDQPGHFPNNKPRPRMRGTARTQVYSPDGRYLYTYYFAPEGVDDGPHEHFYAFVHVLDLERGEAYCIDLPEPFGTSASGWSEPALTVSPDGSRLLVTDRLTGALAAIDTNTLDVAVTSALEPAGEVTETLPTATAGVDVLYLGLNREVLRIDPSTLQIIGRIETSAPIMGLKLDATGELLYAVTTTEVSVRDPDGTELDRWPLPPETSGRADPAVAIPGSGAYQCAC